MSSFFKMILDGLMTSASSTFSPYKVQNIKMDGYRGYEVASQEKDFYLYKYSGYYDAVLVNPVSRSKGYSLYRLKDPGEAYAEFTNYSKKLCSLCQITHTIFHVDFLQNVCDSIREHPTWSMAHVAAFVGLTACFDDMRIKSILNKQCPVTGVTPIMVAIKGNQLHVLECINEPHLDIVDFNGDSVFHHAVEAGGSSIQILSNFDRAVEMVNRVNSCGETPLLWACKKKLPEVTVALLDVGADPFLSGAEHFPIHAALKSSDLKSVEALCKRNSEQIHTKVVSTGASPLHLAQDNEAIHALMKLGADLAAPDVDGNTPLHFMVETREKNCALSLLCLGADINLQNLQGNTVLHLAVLKDDIELVKAFVTFGANMSIRNQRKHTARHLAAVSRLEKSEQILNILHMSDAPRCGTDVSGCVRGCVSGGTYNGTSIMSSANSEMMIGALMDEIYTSNCNGACNKERGFDKMDSSAISGYKVLCLDGGGIRGLIMVEILLAIERAVGRPIRDCFDWIGGTSTGGILALAIAHGKSLQYCKGLYFRLKDEIFCGKRPYSSANLENFLKQEFGENTTMMSISHPKVLVTSVIANRLPPKLHFFRNYTPLEILPEDENSEYEKPKPPEEQLIWEAGRSSGAAPTFFRSYGPFIDGGIMSNNPTLDVLTEIHKYNMSLRYNDLISAVRSVGCVVSLGTGNPPSTPIKSVDIFRPDSMFDLAKCAIGMSTLGNLLIKQVTETEGRLVEQARAWCSMTNTSYFRLNPPISEDIFLDCNDSEVLINMMWETHCYILANKHRILALAGLL